MSEYWITDRSKKQLTCKCFLRLEVEERLTENDPGHMVHLALKLPDISKGTLKNFQTTERLLGVVSIMTTNNNNKIYNQS